MINFPKFLSVIPSQTKHYLRQNEVVDHQLKQLPLLQWKSDTKLLAYKRNAPLVLCTADQQTMRMDKKQANDKQKKVTHNVIRTRKKGKKNQMRKMTKPKSGGISGMSHAEHSPPRRRRDLHPNHTWKHVTPAQIHSTPTAQMKIP